MAVTTLKILTSLALGGTAGVAALATMTGAHGGSTLSPTGDTRPQVQRPVVTRAAPCPKGTVDTPSACVKVVHVPAPAPRTVAPAAQPAGVTTYAPAPAAPQQYEAPEPQGTQEPQEPQDGPESDHPDNGSDG